MLPITTRFKQTIQDEIMILEKQLTLFRTMTNLIDVAQKSLKERVADLEKVAKSIKEGQL